MTFAEEFNELLERHMKQIMRSAKRRNMELIPNTRYVASETMGEVIEKLIILNIRVWHLEDLAEKIGPKNSRRYADIKQRLAHCFKGKRPLLIEALNTMLKEILLSGRTGLVEDKNVKLYGGYKSK